MSENNKSWTYIEESIRLYSAHPTLKHFMFSCLVKCDPCSLFVTFEAIQG